MSAPWSGTAAPAGRGLRASLVGPQDPDWRAALSVLRHDVYHLPELALFATRREESGTPVAFIASDGEWTLLVPLIVRPVPDSIAGGPGWFDATGPRGYPGPIAGPAFAGGDPAFVDRAIGAMIEVLHERRIVSAFVRCHPLLSPPAELLRCGGTILEHGESVSMDLAVPESETWNRIRENHRRAIRRARRDGYRMRVDTAWERLDDFLVIYAAAMERVGAAADWRVGRPYVDDLRASLGPRLNCCLVERDGALAAAALVTEVDGIVEYHLAATAADHVAASPSKLLIEEISRWARARGNRIFHLAGSLRHDDALIHFKRGFSPQRHPVTSWRIIADADAYREFAARRSARSADRPDSTAIEGSYFPAYRR